MALCRGDAEANLVRGNFLRMTDLRFQPAYISVAVSRSTEPRRVVETCEQCGHHRAEAARRSQEALAGFLIAWCCPEATGPSRLPLRAACGRS